jgi:hypothetical protein
MQMIVVTSIIQIRMQMVAETSIIQIRMQMVVETSITQIRMQMVVVMNIVLKELSMMITVAELHVAHCSTMVKTSSPRVGGPVRGIKSLLRVRRLMLLFLEG